VRATDLRVGIWRLADPKVSLASMASMFLGACAAAHDGPIAWGWLALSVPGIFFIEAAKNASGEVFDFDSGADTGVAAEDRSPFSGGKRVLVDGFLTRRQTVTLAGVGLSPR
jgi:1,4-dihydroxy-2-naphthoate octaprenyltransferase